MLDAAAHLFDDLFADRQPQTGTLHRDALRAARAVKRLEQFVYFIGGDTAAAVVHSQMQLPLPLILRAPADLDLNGAARRKFYRVIYQVVSHLK